MGTNVDHHPSHLVYHASLYAFTHTTAASEVPVPSASVSEGWSVRFAYEDRIHATDVKAKVKVNICAHGGIAIQQTSAQSRITIRMEEQLSCNDDHHGASTILVEQSQ